MKFSWKYGDEVLKTIAINCILQSEQFHSSYNNVTEDHGKLIILKFIEMNLFLGKKV
jgi:hypothetical protein